MLYFQSVHSQAIKPQAEKQEIGKQINLVKLLITATFQYQYTFTFPLIYKEINLSVNIIFRFKSIDRSIRWFIVLQPKI